MLLYNTADNARKNSVSSTLSKTDGPVWVAADSL